MDATITIPVPPELADLYERSSDEDRARIADWLREEIGVLLGDDLPQMMTEIALRAQARGLTPEMLDDLLRDDQ